MTSGITLGLVCCLAAGPLAAQPALKHVPEVLQAGPMRIDRVKDGLYMIRGPACPACRRLPPERPRRRALSTSRATSPCASQPRADRRRRQVRQPGADIFEQVRTYPTACSLRPEHAPPRRPRERQPTLRAMGINVIAHENMRANFLRIKQPGEPNITFADKAEVFLGGVEVQAASRAGPHQRRHRHLVSGPEDGPHGRHHHRRRCPSSTTRAAAARSSSSRR